MKDSDWIAIAAAFIALCALGWSIYSHYQNKQSGKETREIAQRAESHAARANDIAHTTSLRISAEAEISILRLITEARINYNSLYTKMIDIQAGKTDSKLTADQERYLKANFKGVEDAFEIMLNAYELACGLYLDGKVDPERFRRQYIAEIAQLFNYPPPFKERLHPIDSPYKAIRKVYEDLHNHEKDRKL